MHFERLWNWGLWGTGTEEVRLNHIEWSPGLLLPLFCILVLRIPVKYIHFFMLMFSIPHLSFNFFYKVWFYWHFNIFPFYLKQLLLLTADDPAIFKSWTPKFRVNLFACQLFSSLHFLLLLLRIFSSKNMATSFHPSSFHR